ncbi:unnamed protein product [Clonostachys rhizophaga]|uniref:Uncharacterized protein n=1 Tax=Clonostachys rhizophaga TaxID=160324 RepID=A0A9N9VXE1_9HYPO|nr:unnamed protein product [Clonostachys rhizophaga]
MAQEQQGAAFELMSGSDVMRMTVFGEVDIHAGGIRLPPGIRARQAEGDGDDVGIEYGGGRARQEANNFPLPAVRAPAVEAADQALFRPEPPNERGVASEAWPAGVESREHSTATSNIPQKIRGGPNPF